MEEELLMEALEKKKKKESPIILGKISLLMIKLEIYQDNTVSLL